MDRSEKSPVCKRSAAERDIKPRDIDLDIVSILKRFKAIGVDEITQGECMDRDQKKAQNTTHHHHHPPPRNIGTEKNGQEEKQERQV